MSGSGGGNGCSPIATIAATSPTKSQAYSYTLQVPSTGTYFLLGFLTASSFQNGGPNVGDAYEVYGGNCTLSSGSTITFSNPLNSPTTQTLNLSFGDTCTLKGWTGTITFTGDGEVSQQNSLQVEACVDSACATPINSSGGNSITVNGGTYSVINNGGLPTSIYLGAYYQSNSSNGGNNGPATCDPMTVVGPVASSGGTTNINLSDTNLYNCNSYSLSGTVTYAVSGATVDAANPIVVRAVTCSGGYNCGLVADCAVTHNGGSYFMGLPASGSYYVTEEYVANAGASWSNWQYTLGSYAQNSDGSCCGSGTNYGNPIAVSGVTTVNLSFNNACPQVQGFIGTLTYNGSMGPVSCGNGNNGNQLYVEAVTVTIEDTEPAQMSGVCPSGSSFNLETTGPCGSSGGNNGINGNGGYYLRAWFDYTGVNSTSCCQGPVNGDPWTVVGPVTQSANPTPVNITFGDSNTWITP
jgi:hypothetical protein